MSLILANIAGFVATYRKWFVLFGIAVILLTFAIVYQRCTRDRGISPEKIAKAQKAIAEQDRKQMEETLAEIEGDVAAADKSIIEAETAKEKAVAEAKAKAKEMTNEQLAAELERLAR